MGSLNGINGTIFMYGQTGSGKTYNMLGAPINDDCDSLCHITSKFSTTMKIGNH